MKIAMVHGSGGKETSELITGLFAKYLGNPVLARMEDSAVVPGAPVMAMTTDSFVVTPLFFPGGDIGRLAVCGTVNDLAMSGATPKYLTCGFILEEGLETSDLERIVQSMAHAAEEAGVTVIAGDTKVIEGRDDKDGKGGVYINTAGVGFFPPRIAPAISNASNRSNSSHTSNFSNDRNDDNKCNNNDDSFNSNQNIYNKTHATASVEPPFCAANCREGDLILLSGTLGDHHAAILSARMNITNTIQSDCAPLGSMAASLAAGDIGLRAMRDVTRGGLATVLHEIAEAASCSIHLREADIPVSDSVRGFCGILGLDPLYMGNEGKMIAIVARKDAPEALARMRAHPSGQYAAIIGEIPYKFTDKLTGESTRESTGKTTGESTRTKSGLVVLETRIGGTRILPELYGEGLPRIC